MKLRVCLAIGLLFLVGCGTPITLPKFKLPHITLGPPDTSNVTALKTGNQQVDTAISADQKLIDAQNKWNQQQQKMLADQRAQFDQNLNLINQNLLQIDQLNYGVTLATDQTSPTNIPMLIANLRSKQISAMLNPLTPDQQTQVQTEVTKQKAESVNQLYTDYKAATELAAKQKLELDAANSKLQKLEKDNQDLSTSKQAEITRISNDRDQQLSALKQQIKDQVNKAIGTQTGELLSYMVKVLVGVGVLFLILAILLKSITFGGVSLSAFGLAYFAATIPVWVMVLAAAGIALIVVIKDHWGNVMNALSSIPTARPAHPAIPAPVPTPAVTPTPSATLLTETKNLSS